MNLKKLASLLLLSSFSGLMAMEVSDGGNGNKHSHKRTLEQIKANPSTQDSRTTSDKPCHKKARTEVDTDLIELDENVDFTSMLSDERWVEIFSWLDYQDIKTAQQVSTRFRQIGNEPILWKVLAKREKLNGDIQDPETYRLCKFGHSKSDNMPSEPVKAEPGVDFTPMQPDEVFVNIFRRLGPKDLKNTQQVSSRFRQIGKEPTLWKAIAKQEGLAEEKIHDLVSYFFSGPGSVDALPDSAFYEFIKAYPDFRLISFEMAYGNIESLDAEFHEGPTKFENFNGINAILTTADGRKIELITPDFIEESQTLYKLVPAEANSQEKLKFTGNEFPINVTFKVLSGHAGMNPPAESGLGLICRDGWDSNKTGWNPIYYPLGKVLQAEDITLDMLFGNQGSRTKTVVLTLPGFDEFEEAGPILTWDKPLDQIEVPLYSIESFNND